eukprot:gene6086-10094_t
MKYENNLFEFLTHDTFYHVLLFFTPKELLYFQKISRICFDLANKQKLWYDVSEIFIKKLLKTSKIFTTTLENVLPKFSKEKNWKEFHRTLYNNCFSVGYNRGPKSWGLEQNPLEPDHGQLGLGLDYEKISSISTFTLIPNLIGKDIIQIATGGYHTLALSRTGEVYSFGSNAFGQLGLKDRKSRSTPTKLNLQNIKSIYCGYAFSYALDENGNCFGWGFNKNGRAGHSDNESKWILDEGNNNYPYVDEPKMVKQLEGMKIKKIGCGSGHTMFLDENGMVYGIGRNDLRQIGRRREFDERNIAPFNLNLPHSEMEYKLTKVNFSNDPQILDIACNSYSSAFLDENYVLQLTGSTSFGLIDQPMKIVDVHDSTNFHGTSMNYFWIHKQSAIAFTPVGQTIFDQIPLKFFTSNEKVLYGITAKGELISIGEDEKKIGILGRGNECFSTEHLDDNEKFCSIFIKPLHISFQTVSCGTEHSVAIGRLNIDQ